MSFHILLTVIQVGLIFVEGNLTTLIKISMHKSFEAIIFPYLSIYYTCTKWQVDKVIIQDTVCNSKRLNTT